MNIPYQNFTDSKETSNEIATKFINARIHLPKLNRIAYNILFNVAGESYVFGVSTTVPSVLIV